MKKYAAFFAIMASLLAFAAVQKEGTSLFLLWPAASFLIISTGYAGLGPGVMGKRRDGTIATWAKLVHRRSLGYFLRVSGLTHRILQTQPFNKLDEDLYLGRRLTNQELPTGIANIVDLTAEFEEPSTLRKHMGYRSLPILDGAYPDATLLRQVIRELRSGATFVHCARGHGRTGLFALAYLAEHGRIRTVAEGLALLRCARPGIALNRTQFAFIEKYFAELSLS